MTRSDGRELTREEKKRIYRREKCKKLTVNIFPADMDLYNWIVSQDEGQAAYIRRLVREDMQRRRPEKHPTEDTEQSFVETSENELNGCSGEAADPR